MSQTGATTERCEPEYSDETKTTLSLMQSMQKSTWSFAITTASLARDFLKHWRTSRVIDLVTGSHTSTIESEQPLPSSLHIRRRKAVLNTVLYDNKPYVLANIPRVLAFRDPLEMEVRLSTSAIIEWEYQRSLFEEIGRVEHKTQFAILSPEAAFIYLMLAAILMIDELIFDENVVPQVL